MNRLMGAVTTMLALCAAGGAFAQSPVKIGLVTTLSTAGGALGEDARDGFLLAVKQEGGKLGGIPVEVIVNDDGLNPTTAKQIAERMLQRDGVRIFTGTIYSVVSLAINPDLLRAGAFVVSQNNGPPEFDGANCHPHYFVSAWINDAQGDVPGIAANGLNSRRVVTIASNFKAGRDAIANFKKRFKGEVVEEILVKINQTDYASEVSRIKFLKPDGIYSFLPGGMSVSFLRQMHQAGVTGIKQYNGQTIDERVLNAVGEAGSDTIGVSPWGPDLNNPTNKQFVAAFQESYKRIPTVYSAQAYDAARLIGSALRQTRGSLSDAAAFRAAMRAARFDSVRGKFSFGKSQHPIQDYYINHPAKTAAGYILELGRKLATDYASPYAGQCPQ